MWVNIPIVLTNFKITVIDAHRKSMTEIFLR